jgi:endonuclease YncB( thermonuclease family)
MTARPPPFPLRWLAAATAGLVLLAAWSAGAAELWRAIDGDTIAHGAERIRVMGVDSPETVQAKCSAEHEAGMRAKAFTAHALRHGVVTIERHGVDKYRRTLAVVRIDGRDLAVLLIEAGHGRAYHGGRRAPWC